MHLCVGLILLFLPCSCFYIIEYNRKAAMQPGKAVWVRGTNGSDSKDKTKKGFERVSRSGGVRPGGARHRKEVSL